MSVGAVQAVLWLLLVAGAFVVGCFVGWQRGCEGERKRMADAAAAPYLHRYDWVGR